MAGPTHGTNPPRDQLTFGIVTGQYWRDWEDVKEQWLWADEAGLDNAWVVDHFMSIRPDDSGPCLEAWTLLGALATLTRSIQLGTLVTGITHRNPAIVAKMAVTVDTISGGRLVLGAGAGWVEREHQAYGVPLPPPGERVDRFGEALEIFKRLETQERTTFTGRHYSVVEASFLPKPIFGHIPLLVGSSGRRMLRHVARYADQWDGRSSPEEFRLLGERLNRYCREIGRDPSEIRWVSTLNSPDVENPDAIRRYVASYVAVGVRSFHLWTPAGSPSQGLRTVVEQVIPELREAFAAGELG